MNEQLLGDLEQLLGELRAAQLHTAELANRAQQQLKMIDAELWVPSTDQDLAIAHQLGALPPSQQAFLVALLHSSLRQHPNVRQPYRCEVESVARLLPFGAARRTSAVGHPVEESDLKGTWAIYRPLAKRPELTVGHEAAPDTGRGSRRRQGTRRDTFTLGRRVGDVVRRRCEVTYKSWDDALEQVCTEMRAAKRPPRKKQRESSPGRRAPRGGA